MTPLERRIHTLETTQRARPQVSHVLPVLIYPRGLTVSPPARLEAWVTEQTRCDCAPDCPGKRVRFLLPAKEDDP
jgi:hypothetical protein